jgi:hypothetical protein
LVPAAHTTVAARFFAALATAALIDRNVAWVRVITVLIDCITAAQIGVALRIGCVHETFVFIIFVFAHDHCSALLYGFLLQSCSDIWICQADIVGGLRSGLTYGGAANIQELQRKLDYIQVSWASRIEGLAHVAQG